MVLRSIPCFVIVLNYFLCVDCRDIACEHGFIRIKLFQYSQVNSLLVSALMRDRPENGAEKYYLFFAVILS